LGKLTPIQLKNDWINHLGSELTEKYFQDLQRFVTDERLQHEVFPSEPEVLAAFDATSYRDTRVVILGQDPYHGPGQAHGLCFSVNRDVTIPPSLANIFSERHTDIGIAPPQHGCLMRWAEQGVLLLNTTLTVRRSEPRSHVGHGWERFTDHAISCLNTKSEPVIFVLWGNAARRKKTLITSRHHTVIQAPHPSPLSAHRGFFGSRPFSTINVTLAQYGHAPISWET
jgi:uracil-DNA glycosylase